MTPNHCIEVDSVSKDYLVHRKEPGFANGLRAAFRRPTQTVRAVRDLSFAIAPGERVGFLGPNAAGKTTTLKMLCGVLYPTAGRVVVAGHTPHHRRHAFLSRITLLMGQKQQLVWDLPPFDTFVQNRDIYGVDRPRFEKTLEELYELLGIARAAATPTRQLSLGERMKCELAAALLHQPDILFLDEPTIGLDVVTQVAVRDFLRTYNDRTGATMLLTSHHMDDVSALCSRVIVIHGGRLVYDGTIPALVESLRPDKTIALRYQTPPERSALQRMGSIVEFGGLRAVVRVPRSELRQALGHLMADPLIQDLTIEDPPLHEVMREFFVRSANGAS